MACANACPKNAIGIGVNKYGYENERTYKAIYFFGEV